MEMNHNRTALITGVTGQDGSYLAEYLLTLGYEVYGTTRVTASPRIQNLKDCIKNPKFHLIHADLADAGSLVHALQKSDPCEVYNLGAVSFVPASWENPAWTMEVNASGVARLLDAIKQYDEHIHVYQASTSEMFGANRDAPQSEDTAFKPNHPYAAAKLAAHHIAEQFRNQYGMHVSCGILFNHESPRRGTQFVTRKVTSAVAKIICGEPARLNLWTLSPIRDWGHARDYVRVMHTMLQQEESDTYCIGTGIGLTVGQLVSQAFELSYLKWENHVDINPPNWFKPDDDSIYIADTSKAQKYLGWKPTTTFKQLIAEMIRHDVELISSGRNLLEVGL